MTITRSLKIVFTIFTLIYRRQCIQNILWVQKRQYNHADYINFSVWIQVLHHYLMGEVQELQEKSELVNEKDKNPLYIHFLITSE